MLTQSVKKQLSIEYAHIYTNSEIDKHYRMSLKALRKIEQKLLKNKQSYALTVLIDDYSFPDPGFDYQVFSRWLETNGFKPDIIFRESQLIPLCDEVLSQIKNDKLRKQLTAYVKKTKKYPCSLFIATWYLLRLGYLKHPCFDVSLYAEKLINILPINFNSIEAKGLRIIAATKLIKVDHLIEYEFIDEGLYNLPEQLY